MRNKLYYAVALFLPLFLGACSNKDKAYYQGYAEGRYTYITAAFSGRLEKLYVDRGTQVNQQAVLFRLDPEPEQSLYDKTAAERDQAKSAVKQAEAADVLNQKNYARTQKLLTTKAVTVEALDAAQSAMDQSAAQLKQAQENVSALEAALRQFHWQIQQKTVYAPKAGFIFDTYFLPGEWVPQGQTVLALLAPQDIKIIFFVNEKLLGHLAINQKVVLHCDGCQQTYTGHIRFISPTAEYTPPVIFSDERRDKLVYRIEASPETPTVFHPGMPVSVTLS